MRGTNLDPRISLYRREKRRRARRVVPGWKEAVKAFAKTQTDEQKLKRGGRPRKRKS